MPGFDGTGPRGQGPMTGKANGFCLIRMPDDPGQPRTGFVGMAGDPVAMGPDLSKADALSLQARLREMQFVLTAMRSRLDGLESGGHSTPARRSASRGTRGKK